jgi:hypothetical protein
MTAVSVIGASLWPLQYMGHAHGAPLRFAGVGAGFGSAALWVALARL